MKLIKALQIPIGVKCSEPASLVVTHATYEFFSLLPASESLAVRGRRLNDTPVQRQGKVYAPDILIKVEVEEAGQRMHAHFVDDRHLVLAQGEYKHQTMWLTNSGTRPVHEIWALGPEDEEVWIDTGSETSGMQFDVAEVYLCLSRGSARSFHVNASETRDFPIQQLHRS